MFERILCLNLDRRPERWEAFCRRVPADWPFCLPQRYAAVDGSRTGVPEGFTAQPGAWGCYQTHLRILEDLLTQGISSALILEDDAVFCDHFSERVAAFLAELPDDWELLYLGGQHLAGPAESLRPGGPVLRPRNVNRTHAYAVRGEAIRQIYHHLARVHIAPRGAHVDYLMGELCERGELRVYCPRRFLVGQVAGPSDVTGKPCLGRWWNQFPIRDPVAEPAGAAP